MPYELFEGDEGLARLQDDWQPLEEFGADHVFQTWEYARRWQETVGRAHRAIPLVVALREGERIVGLFPACRQRVNGLPLLTWLGAPHVLDYGDILFDKGAATIDADAFVAESLSILRRHARGSLLFLTNVRDDARCIDVLAKRLLVYKQSLAPYVVLTGSYEEYLAGLSRRTRHGLTKIDRRIEEAGQLEFRALTAGDSGVRDAIGLIVEAQRERFTTMASRTVLFDEHHLRYRMAQATTDPYSLVTTLTLDGKLIAAALSVVYRDRWYALMNSYDAEYAHLSPGRVLHARGVRMCCDKGWSPYDFCWGDESYKFSWTSTSSTLTTFVSDNAAGRALVAVGKWRTRRAEKRAAAAKAKSGAAGGPTRDAAPAAAADDASAGA